MSTYTCDPNLELVGQTVRSLFENQMYDNIEPILSKHGLTEVDPEKWYNLQRIMDILTDIANDIGGTTNLVSIGMGAVDVAYIPPEMENMSIAEFLQAYSKIYAMRHRGGNPGSLSVELVADNHLKITQNLVYPDDLYYGIYFAYARRFAPKGTHFTVQYEENHLRKDQGGDTTIFHITWD